jgi:hypothetical protein
MKRTLAFASIAALFVVASQPAHAQFMGVFQGATSIFNQVTGKLGNKVMGGERAKDLQAERDAYFANADKQTAGLDADSRRQLLGTIEKSWALAENAILLSNAQAQAAKDAPLVDLKQVAKDSLGGFATGVSIASIGATGVGDVLTSAAMDGVINGFGGQSSSAGAAVSRSLHPGLAGTSDVGTAMANGAQAGVTKAAAGAVSGSVSSTISGIAAKFGFGGPAPLEIGDAVNPLRFFDKHPGELLAKDLYRENGYIGWKRIDGSTAVGAEAYAPVTGKGAARAAVYNFDKETGQVTAAFRILNATPVDFNKVIDGYTKMLGAEPRYASSGAMLRAVWENGAFVTADETKVNAGWSRQAGVTYTQVAPAAAATVATR